MANKYLSKSPMLKNIIEELDEQLSNVPSHDWDGTPMEDSMQFDACVDSVANVSFRDGFGRKHYPINKTIATVLVYDELNEKKETNNGDENVTGKL
tara:strand:+ start:92 stop:379 length:288 start_codon:yes stop_codon:yes gene_type:complete